MAWCYVLRQITSIDEMAVMSDTGALVLFHIGVPNSDNEAGMNYRAAVLEALDPGQNGIASSIRDLETRYPAQYAKLQAGEVREVREVVPYAMHLSLAEKSAIISSRAASIEAELIDAFEMEYGLTGLAIDD